MSNNALTIIFGYRNREPERVARCLASLAAQTRRDFEVIFVDYGSWLEQANAVRAVVEQYPFARYIYTDTRGWLWNRSHALNIGIRMADTPMILTTDVDVVFPEVFIATLMAEQDGRSLIHCAPVLLPEGIADWRVLTPARRQVYATHHAHRGVCQCFPRAIATNIRGFDEQYRVWGWEDTDFANRLEDSGLRVTWIEDKVGLYHVWHPVDRSRENRFDWALLWARSTCYYESQRSIVIRNMDRWGVCVESTDRPVFRFIDPGSVEKLAGDVVHFRYDPSDADCLSGLFGNIYSLSPGHALAVHGASFPADRGVKQKIIKKINGWLELMQTGVRVTPPANLLHPFLNEFIATHPDIVSDYFEKGGPNRDITMLVKR